MNDTLLALFIIATSIALYLPARWAKFAFSGRGFTKARLWTAMIYNIYFGSLHMYFMEKGHIPFYGPMDRGLLSWVSIVMIWLHVAAIPTQWKARSWRQRKTFDPKIRKHRLTFDRYRLEHSRKSILFFWRR